MKKLTKKEMYLNYGIVMNGDKLVSPIGEVTEMLQEGGNTKLGKTVYTWSVLPGTGIYHVTINGIDYDVKGTCRCDCEGCYAKTGHYNHASVIAALAARTILIRQYSDWTLRAIKAQIAYRLQLIPRLELRISAAGEMEDSAAPLWLEVVKSFPTVTTWTYTKNAKLESLFDGKKNANVVKSIIPGHGFNFGHAGYIIDTYKALKAAGKSVYICRCGIDKNQHCERCGVCATYEYVLFLEHSTSYRAEKDPRYMELVELINAQ